MTVLTYRRLTFAALVLFAVGATACSGDAPTGATVAPSAPQYDGGATFGSGNFVGTSTPENTTAADSGSAARGGGATFGSGN
ncbi:MAG TPA: hypothetical protein VLK84_06960 [Longimicrobium sp.]|nr:hypothetical protein [Longimicrobium sp.]